MARRRLGDRHRRHDLAIQWLGLASLTIAAAYPPRRNTEQERHRETRSTTAGSGPSNPTTSQARRGG
jgi:hypothetical protein